MKKFFSKIHLWLSIPFGLIITIICFTGAMLVFESEINEITNKDLYTVQNVTDNPLPIDKLMANVKETLPDSIQITGVTISSNINRAYQVNLSKPRNASIFIDQYNG